MSPDLTIAICAYNAAGRLRPTLEALAAMEVPTEMSWECLVVNNASTDGTTDVATECGTRLSLPLRVVDEPTLGATLARRKAVEEARGEILSFVDDDNLVAPDWAVRCVEFLREHPRAGLVGGRIEAVFEQPDSKLADFQEHYADALAIRDISPVDMQLVLPENDPPCGAGMTGRSAIFRQILLEIGCHLRDRVGDVLTSGVDTEIGLLVQKLGWETWYTPTMRMGHVLPPRRLNHEYLDRLIIGGSHSQAWLNYLRGAEKPRGRFGNLAAWAYWRMAATRMSLIRQINGKKHPQASRFPFWIGLFRGRAAGYLDLAMNDPGPRLEMELRRAKKKGQ